MSSAGTLKSKNKIFKSVIIGAGKIGCFYDRPQDRHRCSTHAHAYYNCARVSLEGIFDLDKSRAVKAARVWQTKAYEGLAEMFLKAKPDIVSITVPAACHRPIFEKVLKHKPRLVFMEKPLADNLKDAAFIVKQAQKNSIELVVNYQRQWMKELIHIQQKYRKAEFGNFISGAVYYNKGFLNNGSHFLHLMISLFGDMKGACVIDKRIDYSDSDPTLDAVVKFGGGRVYFIGLDSRRYSIAEADLFFEKCRITIKDFGRVIITYSLARDAYYPQEKVLRPLKPLKTSLSLLEDALVNIVGILDGVELPVVSGNDALRTQKALTEILKKVR